MSYHDEAIDDGAVDARRPLAAVTGECRDQLGKLAALVSDLIARTQPLRLSVPRPEKNPETPLAAARDQHSPAVEKLSNLRDDIKQLQRTVADLLEELEV